MSFQAYTRPLATVTLFKYLERVLAAADDNWPEVVGKLFKAQNNWACLERLLGR